MCHINEYFSYDDIEDSEIKGDTMLELSTTNFSTEVQRLRDAMSESIRQNIILRQTEYIREAHVKSVPHAISNFLPQQQGCSATREVCKITTSLAQASLKYSSTTAEELELVSIFRSFMDKLKAAAPRRDDSDCASASKSFLIKVATLQGGLLSSIKKITGQRRAASSSPPPPNHTCVQQDHFNLSTPYAPTIMSPHDQDAQAQHRQQQYPIIDPMVV
ncbi:hypothetical protein GQ44DRAFT_785180 [Phaeosphaeriaceae sp. PMI808]|nr:hypothetical protein GQ44DRAFT_785180 [Phaeosphaeriaceae sp. PMI808]